jgi:hypothetical protein
MMVRPDRSAGPRLVAGRRDGDPAPGTCLGRLRLRPALEAQVGYPTEVLRIVRDEGQDAGPGRRGDEQIEVLDQRALPAQLRLDVPENPRGLWIYAKNRTDADEVIDRALVCFQLGRAGSTVAQLRQCDHRDAYRFRADFGETIADLLASSQPENARIGIEQEVYSAGGPGLDRRAS